MMTYRCLLLLLISAVGFTQTPPSAAPKKPAQAPAAQTAPAPKPEQPKPPEVAPSAPVITVNGVCDTKAGERKSADCKTVVTRAEFERLIAVVNPQEVSPGDRRQVAENLAKMMAAAHRAEEMGLQDKPQVQEILRIQRMVVLMQELVRTLKDQFAHSSPEEVQKYYDAHKDQYEEASFHRVIVPRPKTPDGKPADEAVFKASAERVRQEIIAGGDFDKVQQAAFIAAGLKQAPPTTKVGPITVTQLPDAHKQAFALKVGEVSQLVADPDASYIYKLESKRVVPLDEAKVDIEKSLQAEKLDKAVQEIGNSAQPVLNPAYFGATTGEEKVTPPTGHPGMTPPTQNKPPSAPPK